LTSRYTSRHVVALAAELGLAGVIALLVVVLAWAHNERFDLTPTKEHTLSDQAQRVAARLDRDVVITIFYNSQDQGKVREVKELLRRFGEQSGHVHYAMYDLDRSPLMASKLGIVNYNSGVIEGYDRAVKLRDVSEDQMTTQLNRLIEGKARIALFTVGHGEHDPASSDQRSGLSLAAKGLEAENYGIERSNDLRGGIPEEVALLVVANPTSDFTEGEIAAVDAYLRRGGGALFLLEAGTPPRLAALLRRFGIEGGNDLIVDERNRLFFADSFAPQVALFNEKILPYTGAPPAVLPLAQSIRVVEPEVPGVQLAPFAFTGSDTWSDMERVAVEGAPPVFRPEVDVRGPIPVAVIAHLAEPEAGGATGEEPSPDDAGSTVAVGDAEFATNLYVGSLGNRDFFLNLAHLAARAEVLIATRGESRPGGTFSQIYLTANQARILFWTGVVLLPGVVLALGGIVGWRRRVRSAA
jgi:gliding motility-associatede transport system auxiliary component